MRLDNFSFALPRELIARYPLSQRSASRLLCVQEQEELIHSHFNHIVNLVTPGDLLVFNDTRVIPARLIGQKRTGGRAEVLVERILDNQQVIAQIHANKKPRIGDRLSFQQDICLEILDKKNFFYTLRHTHAQRTILEIIEAIGYIPLPPYMQRQPDDNDKERYQTVYAKHKGSAASPTAGLHFDNSLLKTLHDKKVAMGYLTLHIGAGTFAPVRVDNLEEHKMHTEYFSISVDLCKQIEETKANGKRIIAVGTTSLRALESSCQNGVVQPYSGETDIFIYPGYKFCCVDALITNLHLPCSTLLMLVCAFGGYDEVMHAYHAAVDNHYRFYSYGDAMWVDRHI
jgi:S-adenosylmethionine:tRNA ribosyltransferase-isomerase